MQYVGIDWAYRRAAWCAKDAGGTVLGEGLVPADEDRLGRLVLELGTDGSPIRPGGGSVITTRSTAASPS